VKRTSLTKSPMRSDLHRATETHVLEPKRLSGSLALAAVLLAAVLSAPGQASAERGDLTDAPPIRSQLSWRTERHQIAPMLGVTINDEYSRSLSAGLSYRYHFANWIGVGFDFMATYHALDTGLTEQIDSVLSKPGANAKPSTSTPGILINAAATFIPIYGKMMWFGSLPVAYDFQITIGAGYATTNGDGRIENGGSFAPMVGVGTRLFFSEWIAVELGVRDYIIEMAQSAPASVVNPEKSWVQNFMVTFGVSFFFPPDLEHEP
jgi:outer membrane beta-barrel protein